MNRREMKQLEASWLGLCRAVGGPLAAIESSADLDRAAGLLDELLEETTGNPEHPLQSLIALLASLIEIYETATLNEADAPPVEVLRLLMESNGLTQNDLASDVGGQSVVSQILGGRRTINARQAGALAVRFGVSPAVFIAKPAVAAVQPRRSHRNAWIGLHVADQNIVVRGEARFTKASGTNVQQVVDERRSNVIRELSSRQSTPNKMLTVKFLN